MTAIASMITTVSSQGAEVLPQRKLSPVNPSPTARIMALRSIRSIRPEETDAACPLPLFSHSSRPRRALQRVDLVGVEPTPLGLKTRLVPTRPGPPARAGAYLVGACQITARGAHRNLLQM